MKTKKTVVVLGAGRMGCAIAMDLSSEYRIVAVDSSLRSLYKLAQKCPDVETIQAEHVSDKGIISKADLVVVALPGNISFGILKDVISLGKPIVDISYFPEDPFVLDSLALEKKVTAVVDCGVAPGLSNMVIGHFYERLGGVSDVICYVGGLPKVRTWPYEYKALFSPSDVIEEYTRSAKIVQNGLVIEVPALSDVEQISLGVVGTLEAFITDGLRTLVKNIHIRNMVENSTLSWA